MSDKKKLEKTLFGVHISRKEFEALTKDELKQLSEKLMSFDGGIFKNPWPDVKSLKRLFYVWSEPYSENTLNEVWFKITKWKYLGITLSWSKTLPDGLKGRTKIYSAKEFIEAEIEIE